LGFTNKPKVRKDTQDVLREIAQQVWFKHTGEDLTVKDPKVTRLLKSVNKVRGNALAAVAERELVDTVLTRYNRRNKKNNKIDFSDMVLLASRLIVESREVREFIETNIHTLIVDEAQDINTSQARFLVLLSKYVKSSIFVGDEKQNINKFQGTRKGFRYLKKEVELTQYPLSVTFRCPEEALGLINKVADDLVENNKPVSSVQKGFKSRLYLSKNNGEQRDFIAAEISRLTASGVPLNEIAVLGRNYATLVSMAYDLNQRGIPVVERCNIIGDNSYKAVKSLLKILKWCLENTTPPLEAITFIVGLLNLKDDKQRTLINNVIDGGWDKFEIPVKDNPTLQRKVTTLREAVVDVQCNVGINVEVRQVLRVLMEAVKPLLHLTPSTRHKAAIMVNRDFSTITLALSNFSNLDEMIDHFPTLNVDTDNSIELTTCHSSKGREWQYVFLINFVQGYFPYSNNLESVENLENLENLEDERNLFYVAITRASKQLTVIESPYVTNVNGKHRPFNERSVFVSNYESEFETYPVSTEMTS
jgi:DNA helicase-2/ATP-dependent DNA helicase PcrA